MIALDSREGSSNMYFPRALSASPDSPAAGQTNLSQAVIWEEVSCLLCGGLHHQPLIEASDIQGRTGLRFAVVQCQDCGLCYTNPRPKGGSLARFYPHDYRPHQTTALK